MMKCLLTRYDANYCSIDNDIELYSPLRYIPLCIVILRKASLNQAPDDWFGSL